MSVLRVVQLEKRKGNSLLFSPFDLELKRGDAVAIQCNTEVSEEFIHILIGKSPQSGGELYYFGDAFESFKKMTKRIGLVLINDALYERLTPIEYLTFYKRLYEVHTDIPALLLQIGLSEHNKRISKLSYSEKKRLHIGRAILHDPELLILEEPIQNVDIESIYIIKKIINDLTTAGKTVLMTTNNLEHAILLTNSVYRLHGSGLKEMEIVADEAEESSETEDGVQLQTEDIEQLQPEHSEQIQTEEVEQLQPKHDEQTQTEEEEPATETTNVLPFRFEKIPAKINEKIILLDPTEIDYIESYDGVSNLHVNGEVFPCSYTMNQLLDRLYPFGFFRCHRSYIVNLQKVKEVVTWTRNSYSLILEDSKKSSVPLSKGNLNELKKIIGL